MNFPNTNSPFVRKALIYLGSGSDISPVLSSQLFPEGCETEAPVILLCDPGDNARSFYTRLAEVRRLESTEYLKVRGNKPFEPGQPPFTLQVIQQPHRFDDKERAYIDAPDSDKPTKSSDSDAGVLGWDWMEVEVLVEGRDARRYRFLPYPHQIVLKLVQYWRMSVESLVIIRLPSLFDYEISDEDNKETEPKLVEMTVGDWIDRNNDWLQKLDRVWTDNPSPWAKRGWIPSLRMLQQLSPLNRTSADRPVWCLNAPKQVDTSDLQSVNELQMVFSNRKDFGINKSLYSETPNDDNHWVDPGKWLFVTRPPERFYKGTSSSYKLIDYLPESISYVIDTQTMNSQLYKVQNRIELKKQPSSDQKSIYTLIELLQKGEGVAVRVRSIDDAIVVIEQAYQIERIPSPGTEALRAMLG